MSSLANYQQGGTFRSIEIVFLDENAANDAKSQIETMFQANLSSIEIISSEAADLTNMDVSSIDESR